jgi:signal transduction histidine kinase
MAGRSQDAPWVGNAYRWLSVALTVLGLVAMLLVAWVLLPKRLPTTVTPIEQAQRWLEPLTQVPFNQQGFRQLTVSDLAEHTPPAWRGASKAWVTVPLPDTRELPASTDVPPEASHRLWLRFDFRVPADQAAYAPVGLYITRLMAGIGGGAYSLWINGELVQSNEALWRMQWNHPVLVSLPLKFSQPGLMLHIALGVPFQMAQGYAIGSMSMGPLSALSPYRDMREFVQITLPKVTLFVVMLMGVMSLHFWLNRRSEETHLLLWLSSVAWLFANWQFVMDFDDDQWLATWFGSLVDSAAGWAALLICLFAMRVEGRQPITAERVATAALAIMTVVTLPVWGWQKNALLLQHYVHVAVILVLVGIQVWRALAVRKTEMWLLTGALLGMTVFALHDLTQLTAQVSPDHIFLFPFTVILVFGAFLYTNQKRYFTALDNLERAREHLQVRISQEKQKIRASHDQLAALREQHALMDERQQVCSDVHDGLGSSLTSAIMLAERGQADPGLMASALHDCLVDIQAVADTIHTTPGNLNALLRLLEARLAPRLDAAGISSAWALSPLPELPWMDQRACNDLSRAIQEALTNVLKHAHATRVHIQVGQAVLAGRLGVSLAVSDDGQGFCVEQVKHGRGLKNLNTRSARLHGQCEVSSVPGAGTCIELWIPLTCP